MSHHHQIEFTPHKFKAFKKVTAEAEAKAENQFKFEGNDYLISYAKYLIQYLTPLF